jgi:transcription initiation factor TFIIIB Brf1 subunit/transcription initiation factor TFIIB
MSEKEFVIFDIEEEEARYGIACTKCGAVIYNKKLHAEWHKQLEEAIKWKYHL